MMPEGTGDISWNKIGFALTAVWMVVVLAITSGRVTHPFFDYIFSVPLVSWTIALIVGRFLAARRH
jgi:hypothetical protein